MIWCGALSVPLSLGPVQLSPFQREDQHGLFRAIGLPDAWTHIPRPIPRTARELGEAVGSSQSPGVKVVLTVQFRASIVGTTSAWTVSGACEPLTVEIGATQLSPSVWGTGVNRSCKMLMLDELFDAGVATVQLQTDECNHRSIAAIAKLGATDLGLRPDPRTRRDGSQRTSRYFRLSYDAWTERRPAYAEGLAV